MNFTRLADLSLALGPINVGDNNRVTQSKTSFELKSTSPIRCTYEWDRCDDGLRGHASTEGRVRMKFECAKGEVDLTCIGDSEKHLSGKMVECRLNTGYFFSPRNGEPQLMRDFIVDPVQMQSGGEYVSIECEAISDRVIVAEL